MEKIEISRRTGLNELKRQYMRIVGELPPNKIAGTSYIAYKNVLINEMLKKPNVSLRFGERISKNKPLDWQEQKIDSKGGRPRTTGRERICNIVKAGTNTNRLAEQNYECKGQPRTPRFETPQTPRQPTPQTPREPTPRQPTPRQPTPEEKKEVIVIRDGIDFKELQNITEDGLRRIITSLIPYRDRNKDLLIERYNAPRGVLNDLKRPSLLDLLERNNIREISGSMALRILRYRGK